MADAAGAHKYRDTRICAFCLTSISGIDVKLCGGCKRRAYCSQKCQIADWSYGTSSQVHKIWCKLDCGEEDLDWEVVPVPGKGLGLVAMRFIPAKSRIMVDAARSDDHPGIQDLMPLNGTTREKISLNCLTGTDNVGVTCLKLARANHECYANADHWHDPTFNVKILYALHDIEKGEEICINYGYCLDVTKDVSTVFTRTILKLKWGIECSKTCLCWDTEFEKMVEKARKLDSSILSLAMNGKVADSLEAVEKLLKIHDKIQSSYVSINRTLYDGFQVAIMRKRTLGKGIEYIRRAYEISANILSSPKSELSKKYKNFITNPSTHKNYLALN